MMKKLLLLLFLFLSLNVVAQFNFFGSHGGTITAEMANNGKLYNFYAITDSRLIANTGWHVPTVAELQTLVWTNSGNDLKMTGNSYWSVPSAGTNTTGFTAYGSGWRYCEGPADFSFIKERTSYYSSETRNGGHFVSLDLYYSSSVATVSIENGYTNPYKFGLSVRLVKDNSTYVATYTGNDGKVYPTFQIGSTIWMAQNLKETKYRNGNSIPNVVSMNSWRALTTGAWCWYGNNPGYE